MMQSSAGRGCVEHCERIMRCAKCGATSREGKRFCADCGAALLAAVRAEPASRSVAGAVAPTERIQSERRHLTVLFGDLVNSTRLAAEYDPEEWRDIVTECLEAAGDAIKDLGGYVARYMGDGVLAYFGWPTASEDDAERAVRAGLTIIKAVAPLNRRLTGKAGSELAIRVGIHSGWVVIDELGTNKVEVFGDTPNIASRVQARCAPNSVLMTGAVHDLVAGQFLVEEFRSRIKDAHIWMECAGERFSESTPFHAVIKLLEQALGGEKEESAEGRIRQLNRALRLSGLDSSEMVPLIAEMLKLPPSREYPLPQFAPEEARGRLLAGLAGWVLKLAKLQPLILAIEDLHWVDPSSIELIGMLIEQSADVPLMLMATARPEYQPPWESRATDKSIVLGRLSNDEIAEMIAGSSDVEGLTEEVVAGVVKRSDGVPIFAEELLSFVLEGEGDPTANNIPTTLLDSLTARLDRLGPARRVAQVAAVLGREFDYPLLR